MRDVADRICTWLDNFKEIGDIIVNVDPIHCGLPWAGIKLLLQVGMKSKSVKLQALTLNRGSCVREATDDRSSYRPRPGIVPHQPM
jgi:hypothetical protein